MGFKTLALSALAVAANASPLIHARTGNVTVYTNSNGLNFTQMNPSLPNVTILATGGTIAGSSSSNTATAGYKAGAVSIKDLMNAVPEMLDVANVAGVQVTNVQSTDVTTDILLDMANTLNNVLCNDPTMSGAVVTHGTDTLEETAFFLDATVNCAKPVVVVGAMRPASAISADGPFNLLQGVTVAVDKKARNRGAMVVLNDRIVSAFYVSKTNANAVDTFKAEEMGNLGMIVSNTPYFFYPAVEPTGKIAFDVAKLGKIPRVDILYAYEDMQNDTLYNSIESGAKGVVIAGAGAGVVSTSFDGAIDDVIANHHVPVVQSFRTGNGEVPVSGVVSDKATHIASGFLNPQKSRILLELLLAENKDVKQIKQAFAKSAAA
ncbi:hypothetical protein AWENTII_001845 [Aspergillus wentii]|nr:hypothetical protein MW887_010108 [Aspergillus wentii]